MEKIGYFSERLEDGSIAKSSTRLNSFLLLICFFIFNIIYLLNDGDIEMNFILFNFVLLIGVFAPKYLHKLAELAAFKK